MNPKSKKEKMIGPHKFTGDITYGCDTCGKDPDDIIHNPKTDKEKLKRAGNRTFKQTLKTIKEIRKETIALNNPKPDTQSWEEDITILGLMRLQQEGWRLYEVKKLIKFVKIIRNI